MFTKQKIPQRSAGTGVKRAFRLVETKASHADEDVAGIAHDVRVWVADRLQSLRKAVREKPLSAVMIAMGTGAVLSALRRRA